MAKESVVWTDTAQRQRREVLKYWTLRNGSTRYAEKLIRLIKVRIKFIVENPDAGKMTNHPETRVTAMGNFSIYYRVIKGQIIIMAFWDNRQDPDKLFDQLRKV
jgi:plasmid stabilization system protein ParE